MSFPKCEDNIENTDTGLSYPDSTPPEDLLRVILSALSSHVLVLDSEGVITYASPSWEELARSNQVPFGTVSIGVNYLKVCEMAVEKGDASAAHALEAIACVLSGGETRTLVEYMCETELATRWFLMVVDAMPDKSGRVVVTHTDITALKHAERDLGEIQIRYTMATDAGRVSVWDMNLRTGSVLVDRTLPSGLGYDEVQNRSYADWLELIHPEDRRRILDHEATVRTLSEGTDREGNTPIPEIEFRIVGKDGEIHWFLNRGTVLRNPDGSPYRVLGTVTDITERKRAEQSLLLSEERFAAAFRASPYALVIGRKSDERIIDVNRKWEELFLFNRDEAVGRSGTELGIFVNPTDLERMREISTRGSLEGVEVALRNMRGEIRQTSVSAEAITIGDEACFITMIQDITDRKIVEETLRSRNQQVLELAGKLLTAQEEERRRISRELHDDLSQRLAALSIDLSRLRQSLLESDEFMTLEMTRIQDSVVELAQSVRELSHNLHPAVLEHAGLVAALRSFVAEFERLEGVKVIQILPDGRLDPPREEALCLFRIAQEALHNVAKHSGEKQATLRLSAEDDKVELLVRDKGQGFDPDTVATCGHLGLASMEERVRLVGGNLSIRSQVGIGTTIIARVPGERRRT